MPTGFDQSSSRPVPHAEQKMFVLLEHLASPSLQELGVFPLCFVLSMNFGFCRCDIDLVWDFFTTRLATDSVIVRLIEIFTSK